ncbi:hypothetical protein [Aquicoccus sp.]|uniref:hypothetical protein n=1 Tax=Aquicoccus sp. TaxID=2055851 RepID=UPI003567CD6C
MKPSFALSLSFEGIALLHRAFPGWNRVGEVSLDSSDLTGALAVLRETARQINGEDLTSKLVIPDEQIKYLSLDLGLTDEDERADAIRAALDGATPYPVKDLVFDWSVEGDKTLVAAVARETLTEAEQFAMEHGFGPVSFVANPPEGQFAGEPFFGQTAHSRTLLAAGETVQRDMAPIRVTGVARIPEPDAEATPEPDAAPDPGEVHEQETGPETEPAGTKASEGPAPAQAPSAEDAAAAPPAPDSHAAPQPSDAPEDKPADNTVPDAIPAFTTIRARRDDAGDAGRSLPGLSGVRRPVPDDLSAPTIPIAPDSEPTPARAAPPVGTATAPEGQETAEAAQDSAPDPLAARSDAAGAGIPAAPEDLPDREPLAAPAGAQGRAGRLSFFDKQDQPGGSAPEPGGDTSPTAQDEVHHGALPDAATDVASEKERMTIFGARQGARAKQASTGGKPRYLGLIMTAALLLFLAGVAAWASIFVDDGLSRFFAPRENAVATLPADSVDEFSVEGDEAMVPTRPEDQVQDQAQDEVPAEDVRTAALEILPEEAEAPPARAEPQAPRAMTPDEAQTRYAVTGVWLRAPDPPSEMEQATLDDLYVASIDPRVEEHDAVALPELVALQTDEAMAPPAAPFPRGTRFDLDERGLAVASEDGTLSPGGFLVYRGAPEAVPGDVPERDPEAVEPETDESRAARAELAEVRPRPRPEDLIEDNERRNMGGTTWAEVARVRPQLRPEKDFAEITEAAEITATEQAVAESPKPAPRPSGFSRLVERAQEAESQETTQVAAAVPQQQSVTPSNPTTSSVAKAATIRNQLKMRQVNLIGVYGKPSSRRALVRMSNGRYQKVKVGDRLDGGQVQAIGETELRYQKRGREVILKMPRG